MSRMYYQEEVIRILKKLIRINSINPFEIQKVGSKDIKSWKIGGNETKIAGFISSKLKEVGFKVTPRYVHSDINGTKFYNLLGEKGVGKHSILFYGHMDTGNAECWESKKQALTPAIKMMNIDGKLKEVIVGLGTNDMKAGLAVILTAFKDINPDTYKIKVAFVVDEEFYSLGANVLAESEFMDDVQAILVPEVGEGPNPSYGPSTITLGRLGRCQFVIQVGGAGGHVAQRIDKTRVFVNAATECAKIISEIEDYNRNYKDEFKFYNCDVPDKRNRNTIQGGLFVTKVQAGDGTMYIPTEGEVIVDWIFTPNSSIDEGFNKLCMLVENACKKLSKHYHIKYRERPTPHSEAYITPYNHPFTQYVKEIINQQIGFKNFNMGYSVADENVFKRVRKDIPLLVIGPIGNNCYKADEWVEIESVVNLKKIYTEIGKQFDKYLTQGLHLP